MVTEMYGLRIESPETLHIKQRAWTTAKNPGLVCEVELCYEQATVRHAGYLQTQFCDKHEEQFRERAGDVWHKYAQSIQE